MIGTTSEYKNGKYRFSLSSIQSIKLTQWHTSLEKAIEELNKTKITVCAECLTACCWQGVFLCIGSKHADIIDKPLGELRQLKFENPEYWINDILNKRN